MFLGMFRTAFFLISICCCSFYWCHGCLEEERALLLELKDSINYPGGSYLDEDWVGKNCCQWYGVDCNPSSSRVISIVLYKVRVERLGLWYPNTSLFAAFKELEELDLWGNHIGGWVMPQGFSGMQSLRDLTLSSNNLSGIDSLRGICELTTLRSLYLEWNKLNDHSIPKCLGNLSLLEDLVLWGNELKSYSTAFSEMQSLRTLDLSINNLSADVDSLRGICELTTLRSLGLSWNRLNDHSIPKCLGNLSLLKELYLGNNELKGHLIASIGMQSSRTLYLSSNNFSAGIDSLQGLSELKNLRVLYLDGNNLDGRAFPQGLSSLSKLEELGLRDNDLGSYPRALTGICELTALWVLKLGGNRLNDHNIPKCLGNLSLLEELDLSNNELKSPFCSLTGQDLYPY